MYQLKTSHVFEVTLQPQNDCSIICFGVWSKGCSYCNHGYSNSRYKKEAYIIIRDIEFHIGLILINSHSREPKKKERHQHLFGTDIALLSDSPLIWRSNVFRLRFIPTGQRPWWWFSRLLFTQRVLIHRISLYRISDLPADSSHFGQQSIGPSVKYVVYILGFQVIWRINSGHYSVRWLLDLLYNTCYMVLTMWFLAY